MCVGTHPGAGEASEEADAAIGGRIEAATGIGAGGAGPASSWGWRLKTEVMAPGTPVFKGEGLMMDLPMQWRSNCWRRRELGEVGKTRGL